MKATRLMILAAATALSSGALWSCNKNKDDTQPGPAATTGAQEQSATAQEQPAQEQPAAPATSPPAGTGMMQQMRAGCPMVVQGVDVEVTDTEGGVALTFTLQGTAEGDELDDLRQRVQHMAQMYEMHRGRGSMMWHHMGGARGKDRGMGRGGMGMGQMAGRGPMPAAKATVTDIDKGVRLELTPTDASQLQALREHVRWHQQRMQSGECWMLQNQPAQAGEE